MATLQTADGRLLRASRPAGAGQANRGGFPSVFAPMWSDGSSDVATDEHLASYESIYRSQPVVAAAVDKLARRVATLPFDAYRRLDGDRHEQVIGDSLDTLIRRPMPGWGAVHWLTHVAQSLLVHGNALVAKLRGADREAPPVMLWPLDWARTSAYGVLGGTIEWWSTFQFDNVERFIAAADVVHFAWPSPSGSEIGVSPLEKLGVTIRLEDAAQRHQTASFRNGSRPSLAISVEGNPGKEQLEYVRQRVENIHKGVDNSARTLFMGSNIKAEPISLTPVEAALIDQRKLSREEVGMVYDLAGPLMNDLTHGTYSNVAELLKGLYRDVLPPWTTLIEQTCQAQLIDTEPAWLDRFLAFDFGDKLRGTPEELTNALKMQVEAGLITRNEARRILHMPPEGDPQDPNNPANQLSANVNNQAPLNAMGAASTTPALSAPPAQQ
jgi:HK97 family phage portal protein